MVENDCKCRSEKPNGVKCELKGSHAEDAEYFALMSSLSTPLLNGKGFSTPPLASSSSDSVATMFYANCIRMCTHIDNACVSDSS